jgi:hypothetical protein
MTDTVIRVRRVRRLSVEELVQQGTQAAGDPVFLDRLVGQLERVISEVGWPWILGSPA